MHADEKKALRASYREKRLKRSPLTRLFRDVSVQRHIARSDALAEADALLIYAPVNGEITLKVLTQYARSKGIPIAYPRCEGAGVMHFYLAESDSDLVLDKYGIFAPREGCPLFEPTEKTLMLVPALVYDAAGHRLGYGGGYYDRYLSTFRGVTFGVCYKEDIVDALPHEAHDLAVSFLATDEGILPVRR